jgi:tripartite-type tricarboxylate transporter receptor subunit TctC
MNKRLTRKHLTGKLMAGLATALLAASAFAQNYPSKPVRIVVPYSPGGIDVVARLVAQKLQERLGQPFIIENKPGARSQIGADFVGSQAPDGHTLLYIAGTSHLKLSGRGKTAAWEANPQLAAVAQVGLSPLILDSTNAKPFKTVAELIAYAKSNPGKLNFASTGYATAGHMSWELFALETGIGAELIEYKGSSDMNKALIAGDVDVSIDAATVVPFIRAGSVRGLAVMSSKRTPLMPELPSIAETVPNFDTSIWYGMFATGGTPAPALAKLNSEIAAVVRLPDVAERFQTLVLEIPPLLTPPQFETLIREQAARWTKALRETRINYQP